MTAQTATPAQRESCTPLRDRFYAAVRLPAGTEPSEAQLGYLLDLARDRAVPSLGPDALRRVDVMADRLDSLHPARRAVSEWIDALRAYPRDVGNLAPERATEPEAPVQPGVYEVEDEIFVVVQNRTKTQVYAKRLTESPSPRVTEAGTFVDFEFAYAPGALRRIRPEHRMTLERARHFLVRYGRCVRCGRALKVAESVERGLGPVCVKAFAG